MDFISISFSDSSEINTVSTYICVKSFQMKESSNLRNKEAQQNESMINDKSYN